MGIKGDSRLKLYEVKCPFFKRWTSTSVTCEGLALGSRCSTQSFPDIQRADRFIRENCLKCNPECEIYKALILKYEK